MDRKAADTAADCANGRALVRGLRHVGNVHVNVQADEAALDVEFEIVRLDYDEGAVESGPEKRRLHVLGIGHHDTRSQVIVHVRLGNGKKLHVTALRGEAQRVEKQRCLRIIRRDRRRDSVRLAQQLDRERDEDRRQRRQQRRAGEGPEPAGGVRGIFPAAESRLADLGLGRARTRGFVGNLKPRAAILAEDAGGILVDVAALGALVCVHDLEGLDGLAASDDFGFSAGLEPSPEADEESFFAACL